MESLTPLLKNNKTFLYAIADLSRDQRLHLLNTASRAQVLSVIEIILNVLAENLKIKDKTLGLMQRYKSKLRDLTENQDWQKRRSSLVKLSKIVANILADVLNSIYQDPNK